MSEKKEKAKSLGLCSSCPFFDSTWDQEGNRNFACRWDECRKSINGFEDGWLLKNRHEKADNERRAKDALAWDAWDKWMSGE